MPIIVMVHNIVLHLYLDLPVLAFAVHDMFYLHGINKGNDSKNERFRKYYENEKKLNLRAGHTYSIKIRIQPELVGPP